MAYSLGKEALEKIDRNYVLWIRIQICRVTCKSTGTVDRGSVRSAINRGNLAHGTVLATRLYERSDVRPGESDIVVAQSSLAYNTHTHTHWHDLRLTFIHNLGHEMLPALLINTSGHTVSIYFAG